MIQAVPLSKQNHRFSGQKWLGKRVGLLGGSFNPPHRGHLHISKTALNTLCLDAVWWLVTPQNPHKDSNILMPYETRFKACQDIVRHPNIMVTNLEHEFQSECTFETIIMLQTYFPKTDFIWISGMDNAKNFHTWNNWRDILAFIPTVHIARPPASSLIQNFPLRMLRSQNHHMISTPEKVSLEPGNTYWVKQRKMLNISSTDIRKSMT